MQALCAKKLCTTDKGMKGVVSVQLCLERQLESGMFPAQVGRWNTREYWKSSLRVGFRHPDMMRNVSFNATSSFLMVYLRRRKKHSLNAAVMMQLQVYKRITNVKPFCQD